MSGLARTFQVARSVIIGGEVERDKKGEVVMVGGRPKINGGTRVRFARLEVRSDLAEIAAKMIEDRKASATRLVDEQNANPDKRMHIGRFELLSILQKIEDNEPTIAELYAKAGTGSGAHMICMVMLKKAGYADGDAFDILRQMRSDVMVGIAQDGVLCAEPEKEQQEDRTPPLASTQAGSSPPTSPPGVPSEAELQARAVGYQQ